jgi:adenosylhomocysteine nucleosidase/futalosine hydrolase
MTGRIIVMFPTWLEAKNFALDSGPKYETVKAGVGLAECAARTAKVICERKPGLLILAGFAGVYAGSGLTKGDTVLVERENSFDLGSLRGDAFRPLSQSGGDPALNYYTCRTSLPGTFRGVTSNSVNTAALNRGNDRLPRAEIENMEGAAFFAVCNALRVNFAEIRTISNVVGEDPSRWIFDEAAARLADSVKKFIDML